MLFSALRSKPSPRALSGAVLGGLLAGALDILYAIGMSALSGRSPLRVLQSVASGLLGSAAFQGGVVAGTIGLLCHFAITVCAAIAFALAYANLSFLRERFVVGAGMFGALVYAFMHGIVLPLCAIPFKMTYSPEALAQGLAVHILLVGLPIALCVRHFSSSIERTPATP